MNNVLDAKGVRKLLGPDKILGVSTHDNKELQKAIDDGADYVGIGACFGTKTKDLTRDPIGPIGIKEIISFADHRISAVAIGGINARNIQKVLYFTSSPEKNIKLDGIAVVSAIMANKDPAEAARELKSLIREKTPWTLTSKIPWEQKFAKENLINGIGDLVAQVGTVGPLLHHITNNVSKNFCANIAIAIGASPAMSEAIDEFDDFSSVPDSGCLINMGMPTEEGAKIYKRAGEEYNRKGKTLIFDPVGAGASKLRERVSQDLLQNCAFDVIKGNDGEIFAASKVKSNSSKSRGVDSVGESSNDERFVAGLTLAKKYRSVVLLTGKEDFLVDEFGNALVFSNGSEYLSKITASGCALGTVITALVATDKSFLGNEETIPYGPFIATAAAVSLYTIASERASSKVSCTGPGTFVPLLIDELYALQKESSVGNLEWLKSLRVRPYMG